MLQWRFFCGISQMKSSLARLRRISTLALLTAASMLAAAAPITATPGSLSSFEYFPPIATSTGGGTGGGESNSEVATLQRCVWTPQTPDTSVTLKDEFNYGKPIRINYRIVGGNGGGTHNGGGGGSSAILKNGLLQALGPGGDGGSAAPAIGGEFEAKAGDSLRLITGGGGGGGMWAGPYSIGGGGGSGYTAGGGGASHNGGSPAPHVDHRGRGGSTTPGIGGFGLGMLAGSNASGMTGGVATYPDGSKTPVGSPTSGVYFYRVSNHASYPISFASRYPATATTMGSQVANYPFGATAAWTGGAGGSLGMGGTPAAYIDMRGHPDGDRGELTSALSKPYLSLTKGVSNGWGAPVWTLASVNYGSNTSEYPPPSEDMKFTRAVKTIYDDPSYYPSYSYAGTSLGGQIILMYQAPVCTFIN